MQTDVALKLERIRKEFPGVVALNDVSFSIMQGSVHVLLGENGAGKSTLVKILSGAHEKTSGRIWMGDREISIRNPRHAQELGIAVIYQELNLVPQLSVSENIFLGREPSNRIGIVNRTLMNRRAQELIDDLGVDIDVKKVVGTLGIAQQQMVEVAKSLSLNAEILIMDEPTSALTESEIGELFATVKRLKDNGVSVIYISHRIGELFEIGDTVTVLRDGECVGTVEISGTSRPELIRMMADRDIDDGFVRVQPALGREMLRVENLTREPVLREISFSVKSGELLGITGLLGSGRTELARALFGVDKITSGTVYIEGEEMIIRSPRDAINCGMGFLTEDRQSQGLIMSLSVIDNICLASIDQFTRWGIVSRRRETAVALNYAEELRIKFSRPDQKVLYLSGGNQQKVVLSKWLCSRARIFILDEPTRGIDVQSKMEFYKLMNSMTGRGVAIIVISSELPEIISISDRIMVMCQGRIAGRFDARHVTQQDILNCALGEHAEA